MLSRKNDVFLTQSVESPYELKYNSVIALILSKHITLFTTSENYEHFVSVCKIVYSILYKFKFYVFS